MDFVADQLCNGRRFRSLTIVDIYTRESLAIEVGQSLRGEDVVRVLNRLKEQRGVPKLLFCDQRVGGFESLRPTIDQQLTGALPSASTPSPVGGRSSQRCVRS
jgi:transposase InsO family protein